MRVIINLFFIFITIASAQEVIIERKYDPCKSIHIKKAQQRGLRSLSIIEFYYYKHDIKLCEEIIGTSKPFNAIEQKQFKLDFEKSNRMREWTSSAAYCTVIILVTSYLNLYFSK